LAACDDAPLGRAKQRYRSERRIRRCSQEAPPPTGVEIAGAITELAQSARGRLPEHRSQAHARAADRGRAKAATTITMVRSRWRSLGSFSISARSNAMSRRHRISGIVDGLEAGCMHDPAIVAEVGMGRTGRDQLLIGDRNPPLGDPLKVLPKPRSDRLKVVRIAARRDPRGPLL
jgi:hypothetical protein